MMLHVYSEAIEEWGIASNFCGFLRKPELYAPTIPRGFTHTYSKMCRNVTRKISIPLYKDLTPQYIAPNSGSIGQMH